MHQGIFRRELLLLSLDFKFKTTSTPGITWQALSSPKLNMINVDKAYSVLIKNSNRYWINKHRLGPQAALVCQSALHWIDIGALSFEQLSPPHVPMSLRLKGVSKKLRDRTLYHRHYSRSNASYLETEIVQRRLVRNTDGARWDNPLIPVIRESDPVIYKSLAPGFIYGPRFKLDQH